MNCAIILLALLNVVWAAPKHGNRIVGGEPVNIDEYPFTTNMLYSYWGTNFRQSCGGSLITRNAILSAAHCYIGDATFQWRVRLGSSNASSGGNLHDVSRLILHTNYNPADLTNDIAIVKLSSNAVLSQSIGLARIAGPNYNLTDGSLVYATGWGTTSEELMRLMDAELGDKSNQSGNTTGNTTVNSTGNTTGNVTGTNTVTAGAPLPLPDASALDWAALVHTATRAMLQICEEHQYPSMDNSDPPPDSTTEVCLDNWSEIPTNEPQGAPAAGAACACGLGARVAALEAEAALAQRTRRALEDEVRRLRRHNARLRDESARAVCQLRHFTHWLKRTVDRQ